jgi:hypothetical protein
VSACNRKVQLGLSAGLVAAVVLLTPARGVCAQSAQPSGSTCSIDSQIPAKDLASIDKAAIEFVQEALSANPETAYANFTDEAKSGITSENFATVFKQGIQPMGPFINLHAAHTYLAQVTGGAQEQRVICGDLASAGKWVAVNIKQGPAQAHVIVEAQTPNNIWAFVLWLVPVQGNWRVQYSQAMATTTVGKNVVELERMAATELQAHRNFNAYILYAAALQLAVRGPFLELGIQREIQKSLDSLKPPMNLQGGPPFDWLLGKTTYKVLNVGPIGISETVYLLIDHQIEAWTDDKVADAKNRELISSFSKSYPEYRQVFAGIMARAHASEGVHSFSTVVENDAVTK